jgi:hypothetical protein
VFERLFFVSPHISEVATPVFRMHSQHAFRLAVVRIILVNGGMGDTLLYMVTLP